MLLHDLGDYLSSQAGFVQASDLYLGSLPGSPATALCVYEAGGRAPVRGFGDTAGDAAVELPRVQLASRSTDYQVARANLQRAFLKLDGMPARTINGVQYKWCQAAGAVINAGRDDNELYLLTQDYDIIKTMSTTS